MTTSKTRVDRALAWWSTQAADHRPDRTDVEVLARLGVREPAALHRLLWNDVLSLGRSFSDLRAALASDAPVPPAQQPLAVAPSAPSKEGQSTEPSSGSDNDSSAAEEDDEERVARRERLREYVEEQRAAGDALELLTEVWMGRAVADPIAVVGKLPTRIQRRHKTRLLDILGFEIEPKARDGSGGSKVSPGTASGYDRDPDLHTEHVAQTTVDFRNSDSMVVDLVWPAPGGTVAHFRTFAGRSGKVPRLFEGREVAGAGHQGVVDSEPISEGRRHYAVWAYLGSNAAAARAALPILWARGVVLQPVSEVKVSVNGDDVFGTWQTGPGIQRVEVYRLPVRNDIPAHEVPEGFRLNDLSDDDTLQGFADRDLSAGDYEYRFYSFAMVDGVPTRGAPVVERRTVTIPVPEISDLEVLDDTADNSSLRISWTPIADDAVRVQIHRTGHEVPPGIRGRELDIDGLERNGFTDTSRLDVAPTLDDGGRAWITVDWPENMDRVHITAVSQLGEKFRVGDTVTRTTAREIPVVYLHERVDEQYLTFQWPSGAGFVQVRQKPAGVNDADPETWPEVKRIKREDHERYGGLHLGPLPAAGCTLALAGVAYQGGVAHSGEQTLVTYAGLTRLNYDLSEQTQIQGRLRKTEVSMGHQLTVRASADADVPVVLVRNPHRLPLHHRDGARLMDGRLQSGPGVSVVMWSGLQTAATGGYVRMFVDLPDAEQHRFAVLDPDPRTLWWG